MNTLAGFNADALQTPHCKTNGYVPAGFGLTPPPPPPNLPPPPPGTQGKLKRRPLLFKKRPWKILSVCQNVSSYAGNCRYLKSSLNRVVLEKLKSLEVRAKMCTASCMIGAIPMILYFALKSHTPLLWSCPGVCGNGVAESFPFRCYFNNDPAGRYICCDLAGCNGATRDLRYKTASLACIETVH